MASADKFIEAVRKGLEACDNKGKNINAARKLPENRVLNDVSNTASLRNPHPSSELFAASKSTELTLDENTLASDAAVICGSEQVGLPGIKNTSSHSAVAVLDSREDGRQKQEKLLRFNSDSESSFDVGRVISKRKTLEQKSTKAAKHCSSAEPSQEPSSKRKKSCAAKEKRGAKYRSHPSKAILDRYKRSMSHRLYLVDRETAADGVRKFAVMGSNGNIYKCCIGLKSTCDCPDFSKRSGQAGEGPCKHLIFVFIRVLKVDKEDPKWWQVCLLPSELEQVVANAPHPASQSDVMAGDAVRERYRECVSREATVAKRRRPLEGDCPICFEDIGETEGGYSAQEAATYCKACFNNMHKICIDNWLRARSDAPCPLCRAPMSREHEGEKRAGTSDYLNLAAYSQDHEKHLTLAELYEDTHQYIGRARGRGGARGRR